MTLYEVELTDEQAHAVELCWGDTAGDSAIRTAARALADAIRANPPKPPRMDEPGWQPQVKAHTIERSLRRGFSPEPWARGGQWVDAHGSRYRWSDLIDPQPWRADS